MPDNASCRICGGPLRVDNRYGVCNKTEQCRRQKALDKYYRYHDSQLAHANQYTREHRDELNRKDREKYAAQRHAEVTYFMWSPGLKLVKIGITTHFQSRFKALKNGCPDIVPIGILPAGRHLERYLHTILADSRVTGEWFTLGPDPLAVADSLVRVFGGKVILRDS